MNRFVQFATRVFDVEPDFNSPERTALEGIKRLEGFYKSVGLPIRFSDANITDDRYDEMADKATNGGAGTLGQFVKLSKKDIYNIYVLE